MKKGFISALFVSLMIAVPSIAQAEENEKPFLPLKLTNVLTETVQDLESQKAESDTDVQAASAVLEASAATVEAESQSKTEESGLLDIGLGLPVIGEVKIDLLAGGKVESESENTTSSQNRLLGVEIKDSELLADVNLEVLKRNEQGESDVSSGLVSLDVDSALLGQTHVGVLEENKSGSSGKANIFTNLLVVESKGSLLGSKRIGVGEFTQSNGQHKVELADSNDDQISDVISITDNYFDDTANSDLSGGQGNNPYNEKISGSDLIANSNIDLSLNKNVPTAVDKSDARNRTVLNQQRENALDEYKKIINQVNESETNTIKLVASSGVAPSSGPSGSSGSGAANSSGGATGLAAYLAVDYHKEIETCCQVTDGFDELSDQWRESPPSDPPKAPFFLIA